MTGCFPPGPGTRAEIGVQSFHPGISGQADDRFALFPSRIVHVMGQGAKVGNGLCDHTVDQVLLAHVRFQLQDVDAEPLQFCDSLWIRRAAGDRQVYSLSRQRPDNAQPDRVGGPSAPAGAARSTFWPYRSIHSIDQFNVIVHSRVPPLRFGRQPASYSVWHAFFSTFSALPFLVLVSSFPDTFCVHAWQRYRYNKRYNCGIFQVVHGIRHTKKIAQQPMSQRIRFL